MIAEPEPSQPLINLNSVTGETHNVWAITEPGVVNQICSSLAHQPLYIADGHHRYESALTYQRERRTCSPSASGDKAFNFALTELVDFSDPGLIILPPHRLVRGISKSTLDGLMAKLRSLFEIDELPLSVADVWQKVDALLTETNQVRLVLFGLSAERLFVLRLRDFAAISQMMPYFHGEL